MKVTALWHTNNKKSTLITEDFPKSTADNLVIKSLFSLVSTGTERLVATGQVPPTLHQSMQVPGMGGSFNFPIKYGYSLVGKVMSKGELHRKVVHLLYPHQNTLITDNQSITIIPEIIPPKRAALMSNLETAVNAIWDAKISIGDKVLICGFGVIGALVAAVLSMMPAVTISIIEKEGYRIRLAKQMGFQVNNFTRGTPDVSIHTSGTSDGLQTCIEAVGMQGKIIELSWYGTNSVTLYLGADFHYQRKQIISSQVAHIPFSKSARWGYQRRKATVLDLLKNPIFDTILTNEIPFEDTPAFFNALREGKINNRGLGWVIRYW